MLQWGRGPASWDPRDQSARRGHSVYFRTRLRQGQPLAGAGPGLPGPTWGGRGRGGHPGPSRTAAGRDASSTLRSRRRLGGGAQEAGGRGLPPPQQVRRQGAQQGLLSLGPWPARPASTGDGGGRGRADPSRGWATDLVWQLGLGGVGSVAAASPRPPSLSLCSPTSLPAWGRLGRGETWAPPSAPLGLSTRKALWSRGLHVAMSRRRGRGPPPWGPEAWGWPPASATSEAPPPPRPTPVYTQGGRHPPPTRSVHCPRCASLPGPSRPQPPGSPGERPTSLGSWWRRSGSRCGPRPPSWACRCGRGWRRGRGRPPGPARAG